MNIFIYFRARRRARKADKIAAPILNMAVELEKNNEQLNTTLAEIRVEMNKLEKTKQDIYATIANNNRVITNLKGIYAPSMVSSEVD